ncbi:ABC transporter permease [Nocardioides yefusunii]|uniref:ABC transporter permease n=1 Tax=Nocardioides yefusunii TaxID=2500546 RepID=A0ABW1QWP7_9ACTN|nr:iron ABC transporter permease [Nocardioides yefusunii]
MTMTRAAAHAAPTPTPWSRLAASRLWRSRIGYGVLIAVLAYLIVWPLYKLQSMAFADGAQGYRDQFGRDDVAQTLQTTALLAVVSVVIAMVLGTILAFAVSRLPGGVGWLRIVPLLPIVMPSVANVVGWAFLLSPGPGYLNMVLRQLPWWDHLDAGPVNIYSTAWIVIITGFSLTSFVYLFVSAGMSNISSEHLEAAQLSGSTTLGVFFKVVLPLLRPSLVYGGGVALLLGLGQFTAPLLLGQNEGLKVLTTEMYFRASESPANFAAAAAAGSPLVILGILVVLAQRLLLGNQARFVTHGGKSFAPTSGQSHWATVVVALYGLLALVLPMIGVVIVSLTPYWSGDLSWSLFTFDNYRQLVDTPGIMESVVTSVVTSLAAVAICVPLGLAVALLIAKGQHVPFLRLLGDLVSALPLGIPAVIFGVGFLLTYTEPPFILYGTRTVIVLVYVVLMLPFATRMLLTALISMGNSYTEASAVSGASPLVTTMRVTLPSLKPAALSAVALMFILLTHEFAASIMVRSSTTQVMGTVLYDHWSNGSYPLVAAMSILMTAVTTAGVALAMAIGGRNVLDNL